MFSFKILPSSRVFIACPSQVATGGPELLHQLGHKLREQGVPAFLFYYGKETNNPVHPAYKVYSVPFVDRIEDSAENILIVPEVKTGMVEDFKKIQKVIWWLSVDNFYRSMGRFRLVKRVLSPFIKGYRTYGFKPQPDIYHFFQSAYAERFLLSKNIPSSMMAYLSDYLNRDFLERSAGSAETKKNWVAYNPRKGAAFTRRIIEANPNIDWKPIINMTRDQVIELLGQSKVYIDFGEHPGKDRIPREAAISGCCVITGKRGSAAFQEDVPIPLEFKFEESASKMEAISKTIGKCLDSYGEESPKFDGYRSIIRNEEKRFDSDLAAIFVPA